MSGIEVVVGADETIDQALRRFKRRCDFSGLKSEVRRHQYYEKPSVRARKKSAAARRKAIKKGRRANNPR